MGGTRPFADGPQLNSAFTVLEIVKIEYLLGWD